MRLTQRKLVAALLLPSLFVLAGATPPVHAATTSSAEVARDASGAPYSFAVGGLATFPNGQVACAVYPVSGANSIIWSLLSSSPVGQNDAQLHSVVLAAFGIVSQQQKQQQRLFVSALD